MIEYCKAINVFLMNKENVYKVINNRIKFSALCLYYFDFQCII